MKNKNQLLIVVLIFVFCISNQFAKAPLGDLLNKATAKDNRNEETEKKLDDSPSSAKQSFADTVLSECHNCLNNAILSTQPIKETTLPVNQITYTFSNATSQTLYCRFILNKSRKEVMEQQNLSGTQGAIYVLIYQLENGDEKSKEEWEKKHSMSLNARITTDNADKNYLDVQIVADVYHINRTRSEELFSQAKRFETLCNPGKHKYRIELWSSNTNSVFCYGDFFYDMNGTATKTFIKDQMDKFPILWDSIDVARAVVPEPFYTDKGTFSDPELSISNLKRLFMKDWECKAIYSLTISEGEGDYLIEYDKSMIPAQPKNKYTSRQVLISFQSKTGECCYGWYQITRDYLSGDGKYGSPHFYLSNNDWQKKILCDKVKK